MLETNALRTRITDRVDIVDMGYLTPCWISNRSRTGRGYTKIVADGCLWLTHRLAYTVWRGDIPDGLQIDHLCRQRACCNPDHLEAVSCRENLLRGETLTAREAAQTHCLRGHELVGHNVYRRPDGTNKRECRTCRNTARHRRS